MLLNVNIYNIKNILEWRTLMSNLLLFVLILVFREDLLNCLFSETTSRIGQRYFPEVRRAQRKRRGSPIDVDRGGGRHEAEVERRRGRGRNAKKTRRRHPSYFEKKSPDGSIIQPQQPSFWSPRTRVIL